MNTHPLQGKSTQQKQTPSFFSADFILKWLKNILIIESKVR